MNIVIYSRSFLPSIGGIATAGDTIARALNRRGQQVTLITETPDREATPFPYGVVRRPSAGQLLGAVRSCDIFLHNHISLRAIWPLLLAPRPWVVLHHIYLRQRPPTLTLVERVKRLALRGARSVAVSAAVAGDLPVPAAIIPNAYRDDLFRVTNRGERPCDLAYVGRLVPEKGVSDLLTALGLLHRWGIFPRLRLIGSGPEECSLRRQAAELHLGSRVEFLGVQKGEQLVRLLNECRILAVPSTWEEPFGIVALEGIACGCVVVGSSLGGLPDAIGPCGVTYPNRDVAALAARLRELLSDPALLSALRAQAPRHLARHTGAVIVDRLLEIMAEEHAAFRSPRLVWR
jgi:glycosyltransferase involved in cell wall biosynthesis